ncbi:MAG: polysaccharide deacetylase family protein [Saprospiraceae bacterium]|nr:polysaccharide deacetylase family protein [Saprospiraceae bacterium]
MREIIDSGHEIACHSYKHWTIDKMSPDEFRINLGKKYTFHQKQEPTKLMVLELLYFL